MATSTSATDSATKTPAQILQEQHAAAESRNPTIEDVLDEEDLAHPPPSATNGVMSTKAAGKQKETNNSKALDTQDEEAFPSLGSVTKPAAAPGWGAKGGLKTPASPALSSGASTPGKPSSRGPLQPAMNKVNLPTMNEDHWDVNRSEIDPKAPQITIINDAKRKYKIEARITEIPGNKVRIAAKGANKTAVRQALVEIGEKISLKKTVSIQVPSFVTATIIGRGGANIKQLQEDDKVKINIEKDKRPASDDPLDQRTDTVQITGGALGVSMAHQKISKMIKQMQPKIDLPLKGVPPEFYPFLASRHAQDVQKLQQERDLNINIPKYHTWQAQAPPRPAAPNARPQFVPHGDSHIVVSGDREAALEAKAAIEGLVRQLEQELILEELTYEQVLHQYIVGERGMDPLEFLEKTGCAIVLPPNHQETDDINIIGPADRIDAGRELAEQLMAQKYNRPIDLGKQYANAPMGADRHSRALAKYLQRKAIEREIKNAHNAEVVFPVRANAGPSWSVISSDQHKALTAKNDLAKIAQAYPTSRIQLIEMDPFYHPHIEDMFAQQMQNEHGVVMIVPDDGDEPVVLVYEGPAQDGPFTLPRGRPTSPEQAEFERALKAAEGLLLGSIPKQSISSADIPVPRKHHDRVREYVSREQQNAPAATFPVQFDLGGPRGKRSQTQQASEKAFLRGPSPDDIEVLRKKIEEFLIQAEREEKERDYTTTIDFPEKFVKNLVGKNGSNINALREEYDVDIDTRETGKVKIKGPERKAEACKQAIIKLGKQYEDDVTFSITVDSKFHGELIGKGGENLNKIQSKVNNEVRIDFPRAARGDVSDAGSEAGGSGGRQAQQANEIRIRGPRAKAEKVRGELLGLAQYFQDNSHSATVSVHKDQIRSLIGRGGAELEKLRGDSGAQIDVPNKTEEGARVIVTIKGPKAAVDKARQEIQSRAKAFDAVVTKTITVDRKHHRDLIGAKGANISSIVTSAGGPERSAEAVQFPKQGEESSTLSIRGTPDVVDKIVSAIEAFVEDRESRVTETIDVPVEQHRFLIGTGGNIRKSIEQEFNVSLDIPRRETAKTGVKVSGKADGVAQAKEKIISLTKVPEGTTIMVPRALHHTISNDGRLFRTLASQGIKVDHKGQQPPKRPTTTNGSAASRANNAAAPLITDDPSDSAIFSFHMEPLNASNDTESGEIPWVLIGNKDATDAAIQKARQQIRSAIETASEPKHIGYLRLADPKLHRHVIGSRGATINSMRRQTGCDIQVPGGAKSQNDGEEITIIGSEDGVQQARDLIVEAVQNGGAEY